MILTIITIIAIVVGLILLRTSNYERFFFELGGVLVISGGLIALIMTLGIIVAHVGVDADIEKNRIEYESLCERQEIIESEYEDVSKSDVIKDVAEWNKSVYSYKYWAYNPWTNWFYSKRVADDLKMIERQPKGVESEQN